MNPSRPAEINRRILIVDDNASIHLDFREILAPEDLTSSSVKGLETALFGPSEKRTPEARFELDSAYQGQEALAKVQAALAEQKPYALAFVDVRMPPGWDGIDTVAELWKVQPSLQVVVCTAYSDYSWEEMRVRVGQPDSLLILKKPFDNIEVQQLAHALTKKWSLNLQSEQQLTELRISHNSLALSEQRFSKAFMESPIPSAIQSIPDQCFVDVNDRFLAVTGFSRDELIGRAPAELALWENPVTADHWCQGLSRNEIIREQPARVRSKSGAFRELLVSLSGLSMHGRPHALLLAQDVSERTLLEGQLRQAQKMEAVGQLAAGVAHDFNNILTVIQGHAGLLKRRCPEASPDAKSVEQIAQSSLRAAALVRQLLIFSRKEVMQFRQLDLNGVIRDISKMLERLVTENITISFKPQEAIPAISADSSMLEQVAMNLAVNSRDAMPNGGQVTITTSAAKILRQPTPMDPETRDGEFVCLSFSDTGIGMDGQTLSRIFEPFFTTKPPGKGTGLGLSTVFGVVRQHKGWLEVESQLKVGTTFRLYFPASVTPPERTEVVVDTALRSGHETVLVAEDEEPLRRMIVHVLKIQGYTVLEAASGVQALDVWEKADRPIDLLITDLVMPGGLLGSELAERLVQKHPQLKVIYTSGYSPGMAGKDVSLLRDRNFLPKPYSIGKLAQCVRQCLDQSQEVGELVQNC